MKRKLSWRKPSPVPTAPIARPCSDDRPPFAAPQSKRGDFECVEYRQFVRMLPCLFALDPVEGRKCRGGIHPHHVIRRGKYCEDRACVPLCAGHHLSVHAGTIEGPTMQDAMQVETIFHQQGTDTQKAAFAKALQKMQEQRIWP